MNVFMEYPVQCMYCLYISSVYLLKELSIFMQCNVYIHTPFIHIVIYIGKEDASTRHEKKISIHSIHTKFTLKITFINTWLVDTIYNLCKSYIPRSGTKWYPTLSWKVPQSTPRKDYKTSFLYCERAGAMCKIYTGTKTRVFVPGIKHKNLKKHF